MKVSMKLRSSQFLVKPTRQTINPMALKLSPHTIILSEVYQMEEFANGLKLKEW